MSYDAPHPEYLAQLAARRVSETTHATADRRLSAARLLIVGVTLVLAWSAFWQDWISGWWLLVPAGGVGVLIQAHDRVIRKRETATRAVQWYERGLARLENRWAGDGESGDRFLDEDHPYARDLDLFGSGSLFQLVNTCQTTTGEETLARWLLGAAEPGTVHARQAAVGDMSDRVQLREDLYTWGAEARQSVDSAALIEWAHAPPSLPIRWLRFVAPSLAAIAVAAIGAWIAGVVSGTVPLLGFTGQRVARSGGRPTGQPRAPRIFRTRARAHGAGPGSDSSTRRFVPRRRAASPSPGISILPAPDGTFIHPRVADPTKLSSSHNRPAPEAVTSAPADVQPTGAPYFQGIPQTPLHTCGLSSPGGLRSTRRASASRHWQRPDPP